MAAHVRTFATVHRLCRAGFPVTEFIADLWQENVESRSDYGRPGSLHARGQGTADRRRLQEPEFANTYRMVRKAVDAFYKGDRGEDRLVHGGTRGLPDYDDMAAHASGVVTPVSTNYRGYDVYELPPNGQGIVALQMLNILEGFDIRAMGYGSTEYLHTLIEAKKRAYEDRAKYYADTDFYNFPVDLAGIEGICRGRRALIDPGKAADTYPAGDAKLEHGDTIYLTVADADGNMVSLIQSNYGDLGPV